MTVESGTSRQARTPTETYLARIWAEILDVGTVGIDDDFFALGGNSIAVLRLLSRISDENNVDLPAAVIFDAPTVAKMARVLHAVRPGEATGRCLVALSRVGSGSPLFCIHGAGGNIPIYGPLSRALAPTRACYGLQAVGLSREVEPDRSISAMANRYAGEIDQVWPAGRLIVAGYSMGGVIALEVARQARARRDVTCVLLDTIVRRDLLTPVKRSQALFFVARTLGLDPREYAGREAFGLPGEHMDELGAGVGELSDGMYEHTLGALTRALVRGGLLPAYTAQADLERLVAMYAINVAALEDHHIDPYDGDVIFVATGSGKSSALEIVDQWGWAGLLDDVILVRAEGDHHTFLAEESAGLAMSLRAVLPA
jgi:thioesterase domain-containing protein